MIRYIRKFFGDERGASPILEFALLSIPLILIVFSVIQFMLVAHAMVVMKGAAHAAARSALVNQCRPTSISGALENPLGLLGSGFFECDERKAEWETAAKIALLPISASNGSSRTRQNGCSYPEALIKILQADAVRQELSQTIMDKACYAFEPGNVEVDVRWGDALAGVSLGQGPPPITATVRFRIPLLAPVRMIFASGSRSDGTYYWEKEVEVTLL